jgi:hypothetical protein
LGVYLSGSVSLCGMDCIGGVEIGMDITRITSGVFKGWADEYLVHDAGMGQAIISKGMAISKDGQTWDDPDDLALDVPDDGEWYTICLRWISVEPNGWHVVRRILPGLSYDHDGDKTVLAAVRSVDGRLEIRDRRQFAMWE